MERLLYFPGCTLKTYAKNLEVTALAVLKKFGYELIEMEDWNCCGVVASLTQDDLMHHLAPLRNLIRVQDAGEKEVVVICDMCYNTLKQTNLRVKENKEDLEKLNAFMDEEEDYGCEVEVTHLLEMLRDRVGFDRIRKSIKKPLKGMKIMPYYGCMLLRPREVSVDDPEDPYLLGELLRALGAEVVDVPYKIECCGSYHTIDMKETVSRRSYVISMHGIKRGADAIALSCPLCHFNLDKRGKEAEKLYENYRQIPVLYYTQLMALALDLDVDLGFEEHAVDPRDLLEKKGII